MSNTDIKSLDEFKILARKKTHRVLFNYFSTGAGDDQTLEDSKAAFKRFRLKPRIFRSDPNPDLGVSIQGHPIRVPFGIAPTAIQASAHPDGESATAKAAEGFGTIMILSSISQTTIEDVRKSAPNAHLWMQTYVFKDRRNTIDIVRRAEKEGFEAIVVTVDSPVIGRFSQSLVKYEEFKEDVSEHQEKQNIPMKCLVNVRGCPSDIERAKAAGDVHITQYVRNQIGESYPKWEDLASLRKLTNLPIILKGIISAESAREAVAAGVQGIIVSAHGGRQLDGVQAPIEALPEIVDALRGSNVEVYMDGGVRSGRDVFKALAIGAKAVFIGRPIIWGLICDGTSGVKQVLQHVEDELVNTMALCGCNRVAEITPSLVMHESQVLSKL